MKFFIYYIITLFLFSFANSLSKNNESDNNPTSKTDGVIVKKLSLADCIDFAKKNNHNYTSTEYDIKISEAQYRQAKSGYLPNISLNSHYVHMDKDPMMVNAPTTMDILGLSVDVPVQNIKLMDNDLLEGTIELIYPLFTGGKISSIISQAKNAVEIANYESKKNDTEVITNIKKMYYSVLLSNILCNIARDAYIQIEVTNGITEQMFNEGSGSVLKTDILKSKMLTNTFASIVTSLEYKSKMALSGLKNSIGLNSDEEIEILDDSIAYKDLRIDETQLKSILFNNHPDLAIVNTGMEALDARIDEAWSDLYPKIALFGNYKKIFNNYDYGMVSPNYKSGWNVGIGLQIPIFNGFLSMNKVDEAKARYSKLSEQQKLLENGLSTILHIAYLKLESAIEQEKDSKLALESSIESRDLNERAYQSDLVEAQDLLIAQIIESLMKARYQMVLYEYQIAKIELESILGVELEMIRNK